MLIVVGQVTMADRSAAERACKDPNPIIDGRKTNVNLAYLGAKPRTVPGRTLPGYSAITFRSKSTRVKILPLQLGGGNILTRVSLFVFTDRHQDIRHNRGVSISKITIFQRMARKNNR